MDNKSLSSRPYVIRLCVLFHVSKSQIAITDVTSRVNHNQGDLILPQKSTGSHAHTQASIYMCTQNKKKIIKVSTYQKSKTCGRP